MASRSNQPATKQEEDALIIDFKLGSSLDKGVDVLDRVLFMVGEVTEELAARVIVTLMALDSKPGPIRIVLNSCGGNEHEGFAIYDTIKSCQNPVEIYGLGQVFSIAALIMQAGTYRAMFSEAMFMAHNGEITIEGGLKSDDVSKLAQETKRSNDRYHELIANRSLLSLETIEDFCLKEKFFTAQEALDAGLIDEVVTRLPPLKISRGKNR
jgi:ATP-dependent Clp protease, protease subunit